MQHRGGISPTPAQLQPTETSRHGGDVEWLKRSQCTMHSKPPSEDGHALRVSKTVHQYRPVLRTSRAPHSPGIHDNCSCRHSCQAMQPWGGQANPHSCCPPRLLDVGCSSGRSTRCPYAGAPVSSAQCHNIGHIALSPTLNY